MRFTNKYHGTYLLTQIVMYLIAPVTSFITSLRFYKSSISQIFFVLFAFYFGYKVDVQMDLFRHYVDAVYEWNIGLSNAMQDPSCLYWGKEPYHFLFKWLIGQFSHSSRFFAGCAAATYATVFLFFIRQYRQFWQGRLRITPLLALLGMAVTVEYYWYLGLRYWTGAFFFLGFYSKYILTENRKFLLLSCLCVFFHYAHLVLILAAFINYIFGKHRKIIYFLLAASCVLRVTVNNIQTFLANLPFSDVIMKPMTLDEDNQERGLEITEFYHEQGNFVYQNRPIFLLFVLIAAFYMLWRKNKQIFHGTYEKFFTFLLTMASIVNITYTNITFYERTLKVLLVAGFCYLFLLLQRSDSLWINKRPGINLLLFIAGMLSILIAAVQQRATLFSPDIWFSNFFITSR